MDVPRVTVDSTVPFVFTAVAAYLDELNPGCPAAVCAIRPREPDFALFCVAREEGSVEFHGTTVHYRVQSSDAVPTDGKPEPYRQIVLTATADRDVLLELVRVAIDRHRVRVTAPRGQPGTGVMRYVWDDDAQCWDSGKLVSHRPLDTMFLPSGVLEDLLEDLGAFLRQETLDRYASLHIAPVRAYLLHGVPGGGKSSLVHCLASETRNNLAILPFRGHTSDHDVVTALRNLPPRCFLCIEDIDCLFDQRATKNHGVSFASLLAALDGAFDSVNGSSLTVFMTTNAIDSLDQALRRRVDYAVEFGHATKYQCQRMFLAFYPNSLGFDTLWAHIGHHTFSTSVMQKFLVRSLHARDPLACLDVFDALIESTYGPQGQQHHMYA